MTEETQLPTPEPVAPTPPVSDVIPESPKKSNRTLWTILAVATTVVVCCLCIMLCMGTVGTGIWKAYTEQKPVQAVLDAYMKAMAAKDVDSAYDLFSPRVQKVATPAKLREMLQGNNYVVFENYESLTIVNFNISAAANTNPDAPQGTVAKVDGKITYSDGFEGSFNGTLEKVDGTWKIYGIFVTVPPNKIQP